MLKPQSSKLSGKYSYPFSFSLPDVVRVDESNWAMLYPLPPKLQEKGVLYIDYKIVVTVRHGLFSVDSWWVLFPVCSRGHTYPYCSLTTDIVHMPETIAEGPSTLRELAYLEGIPIALPALDPGGWKSLSPVEASGTLVPNVIVTARLSIASPVWSCFLTLDRCQCSFYMGTVVIWTRHTDTVIPRAI